MCAVPMWKKNWLLIINYMQSIDIQISLKIKKN